MTAKHAPHTLARIFNTPLLMEPRALEAMMPAIRSIFRGDGSQPGSFGPSKEEPEAFVSGKFQRSDLSGLPVREGVALIQAHGALSHRGKFDAECNYLMGYRQLVAMAQDAISDPSIHAIVLSLDTPGGEVSGCFDAVDELRRLAGEKPIHAAVNDAAFSAGYALASACTSISVTRTGGVGSIGVVARHVSIEQWLKNEGIEVTEIYAGEHKTDGSPYKALPADVRSRWQAEIEDIYALFCATVAENRRLSDEAVRGTKAGMFFGKKAVTAGLADRVETPDALVKRLVSERSTSSQVSFTAVAAATHMEHTAMSEKNGQAAQPAASQQPTLTEADVDLARSMGASAEYKRIFGILGHAEAKGREPQAMELAKVEGMTPETAGKVLATLPKAQPGDAGARGPSEFEKAMSAMGNPPVGPDTEEVPEEEALSKSWDRAFAFGGRF